MVGFDGSYTRNVEKTLVPTIYGGDQSNPLVAALSSNDKFIVFWQTSTENSTPRTEYHIAYKVFNSAGGVEVEER